MTIDANPTGQVRRALTTDELHRIHATIRDATDTRHLLGGAVGALYNALLAETGRTIDQLPEGDRLHPGDYAIPTSQWQAILAAITNRAQAWGTAAEVGLELALGLMPSHYDDPQAPAPDLTLPDYRPPEHTVTLSRDAVDVINACETDLARLRTVYGPASSTYQDASHSWHRNLTALLTMNTGAHTQVSKDGPLSLFVRTGSGLVYALIFHSATRHCTTPGCDTLIADDGTVRPNRSTASMFHHEHNPVLPDRRTAPRHLVRPLLSSSAPAAIPQPMWTRRGIVEPLSESCNGTHGGSPESSTGRRSLAGTAINTCRRHKGSGHNSSMTAARRTRLGDGQGTDNCPSWSARARRRLTPRSTTATHASVRSPGRPQSAAMTWRR